jgi:hypothetical protein
MPSSLIGKPRTERKDSRVNHGQGRIEGWTTLVFLGLAVAGTLAAAAARLPFGRPR